MANKVNIPTLVSMSLHEKEYKTGSTGFFGKMVDPLTGKRYQVTAVEIGSKNREDK